MLKVEGGQGVSLRAGVLLEQAAYCYLRVSAPMLRKYGFHMVLAGNRYTVCSQVCSGFIFSSSLQFHGASLEELISQGHLVQLC